MNAENFTAASDTPCGVALREEDEAGLRRFASGEVRRHRQCFDVAHKDFGIFDSRRGDGVAAGRTRGTAGRKSISGRGRPQPVLTLMK